MRLDDVFEDAREAVGDRVWGTAVKLARSGAVQGVSDDGEEIHLKVKVRGRALPHEVYIWPDDEDWGCDCELPGDPCVHVCAAIIAARTSAVEGEEKLPEPKKTFKVKLRYALTSEKAGLRVKRLIEYASGALEPLTKPLASSNIIASREDAHIETLLTLHPGGTLPADAVRRFLSFVDVGNAGTLDGKKVKFSRDPVSFRVKVTDEGEGFKVGLYRPSNIDHLYRGAALVGKELRPTSHGGLTQEQRRALVRGMHFNQNEVGRLVGDYLPALREKIPVDVETDRLPDKDDLKPRILLTLTERPSGLEFRGDVVYGDPPVAMLKDGVFKVTGDVVPFRDLPAERASARAFEARFGKVAGFPHVLPPADAAEFLERKVPRHDGPVRGKVDPKRFKVVRTTVEPQLDIRRADREDDGPGSTLHEDRRGDWVLDVRFAGDEGEADPWTVLRAWRSGRALVPLMDGGFAPLPLNWLEQHGPLLRELMEARDEDGRLDRNATVALSELVEETDAEAPSDLRKLTAFLDSDDDLPDIELPTDFKADLRGYQRIGVRWLEFLASTDLNGILADDMGLGKTVQALAALTIHDGPHLVVAPTSVLRNWQREAARFSPKLKVNVYHGAQRSLDPDADLTLTSYALLRIDFELLRDHGWTYAILDEAQAIKNPSSQTARCAFKLQARHRLCLTGTPVENRLEELWSLFRFLMPGLLGSKQSFRERFVKPIEAGSERARRMLRRRVRPYVLRRLKEQVAKELPPLTDMVIRCQMTTAQRKVYDAVRLAARREVQEVLTERGERGATFHILEALLRMRQACCDPALLPGNRAQDAPSCKLDELDEMLVDMVCDGHKALIFSQWTSLLDRVQPRLKALGIEWVRLDGSTRRRQEVIDAFQDPKGPPIFLLTLKAGGTGLNLTAADYVIHLDPWWNPAVQQQATDRAHRIGQDKPVVSVKLIAEDTVEERILDLQDAKRDLADAALGTEGGFIKSLSAAEIRSLFEAA